MNLAVSCAGPGSELCHPDGSLTSLHILWFYEDSFRAICFYLSIQKYMHSDAVGNNFP